MTSRDFSVIENTWIDLADGTRLAARVWMPEGAEADPVPAVLEFLPYRKRDGTAQRDESTYPTFAANGIAGIRVDIRGSGESQGVIDGEYTELELANACEVIDWIAALQASGFEDVKLSKALPFLGTLLKKEELARYSPGLTNIFIDRVFEEYQTYEGEMDYKNFLDFVLAMENKKSP